MCVNVNLLAPIMFFFFNGKSSFSFFGQAFPPSSLSSGHIFLHALSFSYWLQRKASDTAHLCQFALFTPIWFALLSS